MSDHFPDATKMVDTPRTDAAEKHAYEFKDEYTPVCESKLVRQLERELNAANAKIQRLEEAIQEKDKEWFQIIESILGFHPVSMTEALHIGIERIKKQKQRIKRLNEAGDALKTAGYFGGWGDAVNKWIKAKEAKP